MLTAAVVAADAKSTSYLRACVEQTGLIESVIEWTPSTEQHPAARGELSLTSLCWTLREGPKSLWNLRLISAACARLCHCGLLPTEAA